MQVNLLKKKSTNKIYMLVYIFSYYNTKKAVRKIQAGLKRNNHNFINKN